MIDKNKTQKLVERPKNKEVISVKWIFKKKKKFNPECSIQKNKARHVAKGYCQQPIIDFQENFALDAQLDTMRTFLALEAKKYWFLHQFDIKSAFLNSVLKENRRMCAS